jgi:hypothetical protein
MKCKGESEKDLSLAYFNTPAFILFVARVMPILVTALLESQRGLVSKVRCKLAGYCLYL